MGFFSEHFINLVDPKGPPEMPRTITVGGDMDDVDLKKRIHGGPSKAEDVTEFGRTPVKLMVMDADAPVDTGTTVQSESAPEIPEENVQKLEVISSEPEEAMKEVSSETMPAAVDSDSGWVELTSEDRAQLNQAAQPLSVDSVKENDAYHDAAIAVQEGVGKLEENQATEISEAEKPEYVIDTEEVDNLVPTQAQIEQATHEVATNPIIEVKKDAAIDPMEGALSAMQAAKFIEYHKQEAEKLADQGGGEKEVSMEEQLELEAYTEKLSQATGFVQRIESLEASWRGGEEWHIVAMEYSKLGKEIEAFVKATSAKFRLKDEINSAVDDAYKGIVKLSESILAKKRETSSEI